MNYNNRPHQSATMKWSPPRNADQYLIFGVLGLMVIGAVFLPQLMTSTVGVSVGYLLGRAVSVLVR